MRYLSLDVGAKKIGLAVGELLASELTTLRAKNSLNFYQKPGQTAAYQELKDIIGQENIDALVIGLPVNQNGQLTEEANKIKQFGQGLESELNLQIHYVDETLSSALAEDILEEQGLSAEAAAERVDQLAASLILQQFLEENALV